MHDSLQTRDHAHRWNLYWQRTSSNPGEALWDCEPDDAAGKDLACCQGLLERARPLVDLGCGNGTQTRFLARHFDEVIGADISRHAIQVARALNTAHNLRYVLLDALDLESVTRFHASHGDVNVYMRAVMPQMGAQDRRALATAVSTLIGEHGRAFVHELAPDALTHLEATTTRYGAPPKLVQILECGITPKTVAPGELLELFESLGLHARVSGRSRLRSTQLLPTCLFLNIPTEFWVFERR